MNKTDFDEMMKYVWNVGKIFANETKQSLQSCDTVTFSKDYVEFSGKFGIDRVCIQMPKDFLFTPFYHYDIITYAESMQNNKEQPQKKLEDIDDEYKLYLSLRDKFEQQP